MSPQATFLSRRARTLKTMPADDFGDALAAEKRKKRAEQSKKRRQQPTKWQYADNGFAYVPGPVISKTWCQYTLRDAAVQTGRWLMLYLLFAILVDVLHYYGML